MSTSYGGVYGYGLDTEQLEAINQETLALFIKNHFSDFNKIWEDCEEKPLEEASLEDIIAFFEDYESDTGAYEKTAMIEIIADVMSKETGIRFDFFAFEGEMVLVFAETMPWYLNEKERALTGVDELQEIFNPYLCELGISNTKIDNAHLSWWG